MTKLICALALALLLSACGLNVPNAASGSVELYQGGKMTSLRQLTPVEARAISDWFKANRSGWNSSFVSHTPDMMIRLRHSNRETTVINLFTTTAIVSNSGGQFMKTLTDEEVA